MAFLLFKVFLMEGVNGAGIEGSSLPPPFRRGVDNTFPGGMEVMSGEVALAKSEHPWLSGSAACSKTGRASLSDPLVLAPAAPFFLFFSADCPPTFSGDMLKGWEGEWSERNQRSKPLWTPRSPGNHPVRKCVR